MAVANCTMSNNTAVSEGGGVYHAANNLTITNSILWANAPEEIFVYAFADPPTVQYSDVEGGTGEAWFGAGCIDDDPLFVRGALHHYYLSQIASYETVDSLCVNAGSDTAVNFGLDELTTRSDGMDDEGMVDMGYHAPYTLWIYSIERVGSDVTIRWNASPGVSYTAQWSTDMETWNDVVVGVTDNWTDIGGALESERYYRVKEN